MSSPTTDATRVGSTPSLDRRSGASVAGGLALAAVAGSTLLRVLYNAPVAPIEVPGGAVTAAGTFATLVVVAALASIALASDRPAVRVGLLTVGVFGALATVADAAAVPAVVAVPGGTALAMGAALGAPSSYRGLRRRVVALAFPAAVALALAAATGAVDPGLRGTGTVGVLAATTLLSLRVEGDRTALVAGGVGFAAVAVVSSAAPFLTGSALLVGLGVVDAPVLLVATAVFGAVAAAVAGARRGEYVLVFGVGVLLSAGAPTAPPSATAVCLGATLACVDLDDLIGDGGGDGRGSENGNGDGDRAPTTGVSTR